VKSGSGGFGSQPFGTTGVRAGLLLTGLLLLILSGCSGNDTSARVEHPSALAQDSAIARSNLPGARGVGAAMRMSDSGTARQKLEDSITASAP
jgi:hypothetical protein